MGDIAHSITVRRAILRMNQAELARRVGVKQAYISMIETGERQPTDEMLKKISAALGCKPEELTQWRQSVV